MRLTVCVLLWGTVAVSQVRGDERACYVAEVQNADAVHNWIRKVYFDDQATFKCRHDHRQQFSLRCTRQGWLGTHPCPLENPRPAEELPTQPPPSPSCPKPKVKNGFTVQTVDEEVYFTCHQGFKLLSGASWGVAECTSGVWLGLEHCIDQRVCGDVPEVPNADVSLTTGVMEHEDVALVTCRNGSLRATSHLSCLKGTWDSNGIPIQNICPNKAEPCGAPPQVKDAIITTPYQNKYQWNSIVTYRCRDKFTLEGQDQSQCRSGKWEPSNIKCTAFCFKPMEEQPTMTFHPDQERYLQGEVVDYRCVTPGNKAGGSATCDQGSWTQPIDCEAIRCRIDLSGTIGTSFMPSFTSAFAIGESVTITCEEDFWIIDKHTTSTVSTCQDDGKWSITPKCLEVTCPNHRPRDVYWWSVYWGQRLTLGARVRYQCNGGFYKTDDATVLTCTRDGWKPDPPCEERVCYVAEVQNADAVHNWIRKVYFDDQATFKCRHDHRQQFTLSCTRQGWLGTHPCPLENPRPAEKLPTQPPPSPSCPKPKVKNGFTVQTVGEEVYFTCHQGFKLLSGASWGVAECTSGVWLGLEHCIDQRVCGDVPEVPNADVSVTTGVMEHEDVALVTCRNGSLRATSHLSCLKGTWDSNGIPIQNICPNKAEPCGAPPQVKDAIITTPYQNKYQWNSIVTYRCRDKFTLEGQDQSQCRSGKWEPSNIKCTAFCFKPMEEQPTMTFHPDQERYLQGEVVDYRCVTPGNKAGGSATCDQGSWTQPIDCEAKPCAPPEGTTNGNYRFLTDSETTVQYFCNEGFEMVSRIDTRTCLQGKWTNSVPVCEATTCHLPTLDQNMAVINLPEAEGSVAPGHWLRFSCKLPGKVLNGSADLTCKLDGRWDHQFPTCEDVSCAIEKMDPRLRVSVLPTELGTIHHGQKLHFDCEKGSYVDGAEEIRCLPSGRWSEPMPSCSEPCQLTGVADTVQLVSHQPDAYVKRGEKVQFRCRIRSHNIRGAREVVCQHNGKWSASFPTCGAATDNCRSQPTLLDGDVKGSLKSEYEHLDQVEMACQSYYVMEGSPMKTCVNGEWQGDMKCLKPCTVDRDIMNQRHITFRYTRDDKLYSAHDDVIEFMCTRGRMHGDARQRCLNGHMDLPTCQ